MYAGLYIYIYILASQNICIDLKGWNLTRSSWDPAKNGRDLVKNSLKGWLVQVTMDGQSRIKVVRELVPTSKGSEFFLVNFSRNAYCTTIQSLLFTWRSRQGGTGGCTSKWPIGHSCPYLLLENVKRNSRNPERVLLVRDISPTTTVTTTISATTTKATIMVLIYLPIITIARRRHYDFRHLEKLKKNLKTRKIGYLSLNEDD